MKTPYEKHKELGHKVTWYSPDSVSKVEECIECGIRYLHNPFKDFPIKLSYLSSFKENRPTTRAKGR